MDINGLTPKDMDVFYEATADEPVWYVFRNERHFGPFSIQWVQELLALGVIHQDHHVWQPKLTEWKPIHSFENFRAYGHDVAVQNLTDNDFESILQAEELKAEKQFAMDALDFVEPDTPKAPVTVTIPASQPLAGRIRKPVTALVDRVEIFRQDHPLKAATAAVSAMVLIGWAIFVYVAGIHLSGGEKQLLQRLSTMNQVAADTILQARANEGGLKAGIFTTSDYGSIVLVANLADGSDMVIDIHGVAGTMVGYQRWSRTLNLKADSYVINIPENMLNASDVPSGEYKVSVKAAGVTSFTWKHSQENSDLYRSRLNEYNSAMQSQKVLEEEEITQVHSKLQEHFDFTLGEFQKFRSMKAGRAAAAWKKHTSNWNQDQARFDQVFSSLGNQDFVNQLFYADAYLSLQGVSKNIARLQGLQEHLLNQRKTASVAQSAELARAIQTQLDGLKKQVNQWNKD